MAARQTKHSEDPDSRDPSSVGDDPTLEIAARLADAAGDEAFTPEGTPLSDERTMPQFQDPGFRAALREIARLVAGRRAQDAESRQASSSPEPTAAARAQWGPFQLEGRLGDGVAGKVYKAKDKHLGHFVALKLFHRQRVDTQDLQALLVEGRQHALVKHPNVVAIYGADEYDGLVGIWMEYIEGVTLRDLVEEHGGPRSPGEAVSVGVDLCAALAAVHGRGLTHGDVKAQNVMRERSTGRTVLMDFSSSRPSAPSRPAELLGTPLYMAPELFDGLPADGRSDLYALGVLLFFLLTERYPYEGENLWALEDSIQRGRPLLLEDLRPDLSTPLKDVIQKAIAKDPESRFQSAGEFQQALRSLLTPLPVGHEGGSAPGYLDTSKQEDLSTLVKTLRFVARAAVALGFLAFLGYANELLFENVLRLPEELTNHSLVAAVGTGLSSLSFFIILGLIEAAILVAIFGLAMLLARRATTRLRRTCEDRLSRIGTDELSTGFAVASVGGLALALYFFGELWWVIGGLLESDMRSPIDISVLRWACGGEPVEAIRFALAFSQLLLVLTGGWFVIFTLLKPPNVLTQQARVMKVVSALAIVAGFTILCTPWRLLWQNDSPPIEVSGVRGHVVAQEGDELFVFAPEAPHGEPHHFALLRSDPRIVHLGETPEYIFGQVPCEEGVAE